MNKRMYAVIGMMASVILLLAAIPASAQTMASQLEEKELPVSEFNSLDVQNDFEVTLAKGAYGVKVTVDKILSPYIQVYVKSRTLYLAYDVKSVPKDIKKMYKGKNAPTPVFRAIVYLPELSSVSLSDNATLSGTDEFASSRFDLTLIDKAQVKTLSVIADAAHVYLKKNAQAVLTLDVAKSLEIAAEGGANVRVTGVADDLAVTTAGSSVMAFSGDARSSVNVSSSNSSQVSLSVRTGKVDLNAEGSSKLTLNGEGTELNVRGIKNSYVDANNFPVQTVHADLAGSSDVVVTVDKEIEATLVGGSSLHYTGKPEFKIGKIIKSTLAPYGTTR